MHIGGVGVYIALRIDYRNSSLGTVASCMYSEEQDHFTKVLILRFDIVCESLSTPTG